MIGDNGPVFSPTVSTRVGCREVVRCSGLGGSISWRRFGRRQPIETGGNIIVMVRSFNNQCGPIVKRPIGGKKQ